MREIILDTETTGLSHVSGDRITEIGCVEIVDKRITDERFHVYINPEREVSEEAYRISGLNYEFLKRHKTFKDIAKDLQVFIKDTPLIIHNASFDVGFLNAEFATSTGYFVNKNRVIDTLTMARKKFPGAKASLDALCKRYAIETKMRVRHGALIDALLLAEVYICLTVDFVQKDIFSIINYNNSEKDNIVDKTLYSYRVFPITSSEQKEHRNFISKLKNPLWGKILKNY